MSQTKTPLYEVSLSDAVKSEIAADLTDLGISSEGIEEFHNIYLQYSDLTALESVFLLAFEKDGELSNDCVIMRIGDRYPKGAFHLQDNLEHTFGFFTRKSMFDSIILSTLNLVTSQPRKKKNKLREDERRTSSLPNFIEDYCVCASLKEIREKIEKKVAKESLTQIKGYDKLKAYRNKRAAHYDRTFETERLLYSTIKELMRRIHDSIKVVYQRADEPLRSPVPRENTDAKVPISELDKLPEDKNFARCYVYTRRNDDIAIVRALKELEIRRLIEELLLFSPDSEKYQAILEDIETIKDS